MEITHLSVNDFDAVLDSLVEPLEKTISHKPKLDAVKQEVDRNEDMIRSALRVIASLSRIRCVSARPSHSHLYYSFVLEGNNFNSMALSASIDDLWNF